MFGFLGANRRGQYISPTASQNIYNQAIADGMSSQKNTVANAQNLLRAGIITPEVAAKRIKDASAAANKIASDTWKKGHKDAKTKPRGKGPLLVFDPYNRLTSGDRTQVPGGSYRGPTTQQMQQFQAQHGSYKQPSHYGPNWKPAQMSTVAQGAQDFQLQVRCLSKQQLNVLFNQYMQQRKALEAKPRTAAANREIQRLNRDMGYINWQKQSPKPCTLAESLVGGGGVQPVGGSSTAFGPAMRDRTRTNYAEEVELAAPMADLYGRYAMEALGREQSQMEEEIARLEANFEAPTLASIPQPGLTMPGLPTQVIYPSGPDSMPMMPSSSTDATEDALTTDVGAPSFAMAASEVEEKKIPWWVFVLGGLAIFGS